MPGRTEDWTAEQKVEAVLGFEKLSEEQRGVFLREKGLHEATLVRWKAEIIEAMKLKPFTGGKKDPQQKRIAALEKELRRKEAALAEAAALLVLKKKADAIWGEERDEK
jgi:transposase